METKYQMNISVPSYDLDQNRKLRLSSVLKYMQEAAGRHLDQDGETYEAMRGGGVVFLLTKLALKITRLPAYRELVACTTWFCNTKGARFLRDMLFEDGSGEPLVQARTEWIIADPRNHRVLRPEKLPFAMPQAADFDAGVKTEKILLPQTMCSVGLREVRGSDIDCNGHLANTVYADILCDFMPGPFCGGDVTELNLDFLGEAFLGDVIEVRVAQEDETVYFEGVVPAHRCFAAKCRIFKKIA